MESNPSLQIFEFENKEVRFVGTAERPEWIAQDVCDVLGNGSASNALRNFDSTEKGMCTIHTLGGSQEMLTVKESGFYRLVFNSRKPIAESFKRWVFHEVLPSIRKTGAYSVPSVSANQNDVIEVELSSFEILSSLPPTVGTKENPLTEENITPEIRSGYGWFRYEHLLENQLIQLAAYRGMYIHRQSSHRSLSPMSKIRSRRVDFILKSLDESNGALTIYELKSNYIDDFDVVDAVLAKEYLDIVIRDFWERRIKVKKIIFCFLSPSGITLDALKKLKHFQESIKSISIKEGIHIEVEFDSLLIHEFVFNEMYPAIKHRYEDEQGSFGTGFLRETIEPLCLRIVNPKPWLQKVISLRKLLIAKEKERINFQQQGMRGSLPIYATMSLSNLADAIDEMEKIDMECDIN